MLQKELCQKDRHLQQHQTKLDEMLRQLSEASYQQVGRAGLHWELLWVAQLMVTTLLHLHRWIWSGSWSTRRPCWLTA